MEMSKWETADTKKNAGWSNLFGHITLTPSQTEIETDENDFASVIIKKRKNGISARSGI